MTLFEFMDSSPFTAVCLALIIAAVIKCVFVFCINRPLRALNIKRHGWPPPHCDADGDTHHKE